MEDEIKIDHDLIDEIVLPPLEIQERVMAGKLTAEKASILLQLNRDLHNLLDASTRTKLILACANVLSSAALFAFVIKVFWL